MEHNFTPRAQRVLVLARNEADRLHHNFVGTEHLLLGLIGLGQGTAVTVLLKRGLDLESVRQEIEKQIGKGPDQQVIGNIPYTPRVKKVLALASKEAQALHHQYVGTEHLLLGLLGEEDGLAGRLLRERHVDIEEMRRDILKELDPNAGFQTEPATFELTPPHSRVPLGSIDRSKRYDVYCAEASQRVVYRNVRFKSSRRLFPEGTAAGVGGFIEIEQVGGESVYLSEFSVLKFCAPGVNPHPEILS